MICRCLFCFSYLSIRHHHGDGSELNLQIFRQFLSAGVTRVLKQEEKMERRFVLGKWKGLRKEGEWVGKLEGVR